MSRPALEWTDAKLRIIRAMWGKHGRRVIAAAVGCAETTLRDKASKMGLTSRQRYRVGRRHVHPLEIVRVNDAELMAERERLLDTDTRDAGARIMGEPHPERSALALRAKADPPKIRLASAGMLTTVDDARRAAQWASQVSARGGFKNGGGRTTMVRLKRDKSNGAGTHKAIVARRDREARA